MPITPKPLPVNYRASQIEVYCRDCGMYLETAVDKDFEYKIAVESCQCPLNEIRKVYEKYKHLDRVIDRVICDTRFSSDFPHTLLRDMWQIIKTSVEPEE